MTMPTALKDAGHIHISEREGDGSWEDCLWDSGLEWYRLTQDRSKPATHAEAQAIRAASGEPPTGGSNMGNFRDGIRLRYGDLLPVPLGTWTSLSYALRPGYAALVTGSLAAFEYTDPLSKWDPSYDGPHACQVSNINGTYWWCDPLAPATADVPVVITPIELRAFVNALPGAVHLVAPIKKEASVPAYNPGGPVVGQVTVTKAGHAIYTPSDGKYHPIQTVPYVRNVFNDGVPDPKDPALPPSFKLADGTGRPFWLVEVAGISGWLPKDAAGALVPLLYTSEVVDNLTEQVTGLTAEKATLIARIAGLTAKVASAQADGATAERERIASLEAQRIRNI